jgi:hypothetical protein
MCKLNYAGTTSGYKVEEKLHLGGFVNKKGLNTTAYKVGIQTAFHTETHQFIAQTARSLENQISSIENMHVLYIYIYIYIYI